MAAGPSRKGTPDLDQFRKHNLGWLLLQISDDFFGRTGPGLFARGHAKMRTQYATVLTLLPLEGARITDLASDAGVTKQAMALTVADLEELGYVRREADPTDGRAKIVRLSEKGLDMLREAQEVLEGTWKEYAAMIGERRLSALRSGLDDLLEEIRAERKKR